MKSIKKIHQSIKTYLFSEISKSFLNLTTRRAFPLFEDVRLYQNPHLLPPPSLQGSWPSGFRSPWASRCAPSAAPPTDRCSAPVCRVMPNTDFPMVYTGGGGVVFSPSYTVSEFLRQNRSDSCIYGGILIWITGQVFFFATSEH